MWILSSRRAPTQLELLYQQEVPRIQENGMVIKSILTIPTILRAT